MIGTNFLAVFLFLPILLSLPSTAKKTVNYTLIKAINKLDSTWLAGENPTDNPSKYHQPRLPKDKNTPVLKPENVSNLPLFFDARNYWTDCEPILSEIRHQGLCDSSWAFATTSMLSDRMCIETKGKVKVHLSAEDLMTCCGQCLRSENQPCRGGWPDDAINFWIRSGIVSEEVNTTKGCKPYSTDAFKGKKVTCVKKCTNKNYQHNYEKDKHVGKLMYKLGTRDEDLIMSEIFLNGPVVTFVTMYSDIEYYQSGVYKHIIGKKQGVQVGKILGWGINDDDEIKFWLVAFSYGADWGQNGLLKILRGVNHCNIEENILAGRMFNTLSPREALTSYNEGNVFQPLCVLCGVVEVILFSLYLYWYCDR